MVQDFIFDGQALSDFGYLLIYENSEDVIDVSNMQYETIKAALSDKVHRVAHTYESNYTSTFFIMKNPCVYDDEDLNLSSDNIRELTRWLARKQYKWFRFIDEEDDDETWYKAQIVVQKEMYGGNCIGLQLTVNANAPYGFSREITHNITDGTFDINVQSDEEGYIYPDMTITIPQAGNYEITNTYENRTTVINNCVAGEVITISGGDNQQISSNVNHDFTNDFNYVFPRLCNKYGDGRNTLRLINSEPITYREYLPDPVDENTDIEFIPYELTVMPMFQGESEGYSLVGAFNIHYICEEPKQYTYHVGIDYNKNGRTEYTRHFDGTALLGEPMEEYLGTFDLNGTVFTLIPTENCVFRWGSYTGYYYVTPTATLSYRGIRKVGMHG